MARRTFKDMMATLALLLVLLAAVGSASTESELQISARHLLDAAAASTTNDPNAAGAVNPVPSISGRHLLDAATASTTNDPNAASAVNPVPSSSGRRLASIEMPANSTSIDPVRTGRRLLECAASARWGYNTCVTGGRNGYCCNAGWHGCCITKNDRCCPNNPPPVGINTPGSGGQIQKTLGKVCGNWCGGKR